MNNSQFRRLLLDTTDQDNGIASTTDAKTSATPTSLGSRKAAFTPRALKGGSGGDFARQMRERNAAFQPAKKFKSVAPKGVKLGAGYTDRAKARATGEDATDADDKASRIKALEEQMKLGEISQQTFEELRDEITGGDLESTHLVKGLDRKLLERVRRGEDVLGNKEGSSTEDASLDADEELDRLAEKEVETVKKAVADKKGNTASPITLAGTKRTRDEIMAELKAQRKAGAEAKASKLTDSRWKRVDEAAKNRIEIDRKGREVLITVDEDGVVKKKVRRVAKKGEDPSLPEPAKPGNGPVLGSDLIVPNVPIENHSANDNEEDDDDDIFEGVGVEYNPLGGEDDEDASIDSDEDENSADLPRSLKSLHSELSQEQSSERPLLPERPQAAPRNYFKNTIQNQTDEVESKEDRLAGVQQLLKKAAKMASASTATTGDEDDNETHDEQAARLKKRAQMLAQQDRDLDDMDMGFGSSRYDDAEDEADAKIKLSEWKGGNEHSDDGIKGGGEKKKRKPKKRKGDGNNMADIMRVIDGRKAKADK